MNLILSINLWDSAEPRIILYVNIGNRELSLSLRHTGYGVGCGIINYTSAKLLHPLKNNPLHSDPQSLTLPLKIIHIAIITHIVHHPAQLSFSRALCFNQASAVAVDVYFGGQPIRILLLHYPLKHKQASTVINISTASTPASSSSSRSTGCSCRGRPSLPRLSLPRLAPTL